jgi:hypothetical protein
MSTSLRAKDIAPAAYSDDSASGSSDDEGATNVEDVVDDLTYDIRNLTACNYSGLLIPTNEQEREE